MPLRTATTGARAVSCVDHGTAIPRAGRRPLAVTTFFAVHLGMTLVVCGADAVGELNVRTSRATGVARFVTSADAGPIVLSDAPGKRQAEPLDFFRTNGELFGVTEPDNQLVQDETKIDFLGYAHTTFRQVHEGVPVFGALLRVHTNAQGELTVVNGTFIPDIKLDPIPTLTSEKAASIALAEVSRGQTP